MMSPKHIGIAAITAEGGALCYRDIVRIATSVLGANIHPEISLHTFPFNRFLDLGEAREDVWADLIVESSQRLHASGAEFLICSANTNHVSFERTKNRVSIPWLHIAEIVASRAGALGVRRALLLGTKYTMQSEIYQPFFAEHGIEVVVPETTDQDLIHAIIYDELVQGVVTTNSKAVVLAILAKYAECDAAILGCTELPLLLGQADCNAIVLDSTHLLAAGAVSVSLSLPLETVLAKLGH